MAKNSALPRRAILAGIPATAIGICTVLPAAAAPVAPVDPVFAKIEEHKAALEFWRAISRSDLLDDPEGDAAWDVASDLYDTVVRTRPTTLAGVQALLEYAIERGEDEDCTEDFQHAIRAVLDSRVLAGGAHV